MRHSLKIRRWESVAVCRDAFDDRNAFSVAWVYRKRLDLFAGDNHFHIISTPFIHPFSPYCRCHLSNSVRQDRCFIDVEPLPQRLFVERIFSRLVQSPGTTDLELFMSLQEIADPVLAQGLCVPLGSQDLSCQYLYFRNCHRPAPGIELVHTLHHSILLFRRPSRQSL